MHRALAGSLCVSLSWSLGCGQPDASGPTKAVRASEAWYAGNRNLQGAVSIEGKFLLDATRYNGALFTGVVDQASTVHRASNGDWGWMPEGIHYDPASGRVLIDTEGHANMPRLVFVANADQIP